MIVFYAYISVKCRIVAVGVFWCRLGKRLRTI